MSDLFERVEALERSVAKLPKTVKDKRLWHNPASMDDLVLALQGKPFMTACGKQLLNKTGEICLRSTLTPIECCVVCREVLTHDVR